MEWCHIVTCCTPWTYPTFWKEKANFKNVSFVQDCPWIHWLPKCTPSVQALYKSLHYRHTSSHPSTIETPLWLVQCWEEWKCLCLEEWNHKELKTSWRVYIRTRANFIKLNRWSKFEGLVFTDCGYSSEINVAVRLFRRVNWRPSGKLNLVVSWGCMSWGWSDHCSK